MPHPLGTVELEGDRDETDGASELVCGPESRPAAALETGAVVERDRTGPRQARPLDFMVSCPRTESSLLPFASGARALTLAE